MIVNDAQEIITSTVSADAISDTARLPFKCSSLIIEVNGTGEFSVIIETSPNGTDWYSINELDAYLDALKAFPKTDVKLQTEKGTAVCQKTDIFKGHMWYAYEGEWMNWHKLTTTQANEIIAANAGFVIIFEAANLMGPGIAGVLLDMNIRLGLPIFMISIGVFYLVISWVRRHANPDD